MSGNKYLTLSSGVDELLASNNSSAGSGDANKIVSLNSSGLIDSSMLPAITAGFTVASKTASFAAAFGFEYLVNTTSATIVCTLPDATTGSGQELIVVLTATGAGHTFSFTGTGSQKINNLAFGTVSIPSASNFTGYVYYRFISDGANFELISFSDAPGEALTVMPTDEGLFFRVGTGNAAVWQSIFKEISVTASTHTAHVQDDIAADLTANSLVLTLPDMTTGIGIGSQVRVHVSVPTGGHSITFATAGGQTINGAAASSLPAISSQNQTYTFTASASGSDWNTHVTQVILTDDVQGTLPVPNGGTGLATLTAHDLLVGADTGNVTLVAPSATAGVPLVSAGASTDPAYGTAVVAGGGTGLSTLTAHNVLLGEGTSNVGFAAPGAAGIPLISAGSTSDPAFGTAVVAGGGTGQTSLTVHGVVVGNATSGVNVTSAGAAGTVLTGNGAADPTFQAPTALANTMSVTVTETIAAGAMINLWASTGLKVRNADNTDATKQADGFALTGAASGAITVVIGSAPNTQQTSLTVGTRYFLGTAGAVTATAPTSSGDLVQSLGIAVTTTELQVIIGNVTTIA